MCSPTSPIDDRDNKLFVSEKQFPRFGHVFASMFPLAFILLALLLPLDNAKPLGTTITAAPTVEHQELTGRAAPKRGKFVGEKFDAQDLYNAYKDVETEYHTRAFSFTHSAGWKLLSKREDVEVSMMKHPSDPNCPYVKMVAVIPTPVQDCWDWLSLKRWPENMPKMDPFYEGVEIHGNYDYRGVNMILARKRTKRILAFRKRDMVFLSVSDKPLSDGTWVSGTVSVQTPRLPREKGYTRAFQDSVAFYKPLDGNTKTKITIVCRIDLNDSSADGDGGWMPMWLYVKTIGSTGVQSVLSMRNAIVNDQKRTDRVLESRKKGLFGRPFARKTEVASPKEGFQHKSFIPRKGWRAPWLQQEDLSSTPQDFEGHTVKPSRGPLKVFSRILKREQR